jgi:tetratricopeptide (TPR) repeat protein
MKRRFLAAAGCALLLNCFGAQAATLTIEESENLMTHPFYQTEETQLLAGLRAQRRVREKVGEYLLQQRPTLTRIQAITLGGFFYKSESIYVKTNQEVKAKILVDTNVLPENLKEFMLKDMFALDSIANHFSWGTKLEQAVESYLIRLGKANTVAEAMQVRQSIGIPLLRQYQSYQLSSEVEHLFYLKHYQEAVNSLTQALALYTNYELYYRRGLSYLLLKKHDSAIADFSQAQQLEPQQEMAYISRALTYMDQNILFDKALADLDTASRLNPNNPLNYFMQGLIYHHKQACDRAKQLYLKACNLGHTRACQMDCSIIKPNQHKNFDL